MSNSKPLFQCLCAWGHYSVHLGDDVTDWSCPHKTKTFEGESVCGSRLAWNNLVNDLSGWVELKPITFQIPKDAGERVMHPELQYWETARKL